MRSEWTYCRIGDLASVYDGPHATPKKSDSGPIFLGISALNFGRLDLSSAEHISEDDFKKWTKRVVPQAEDVVFSYETRIGQAAILPSGLRCCLGRRMGLVRVKPTRLNPHYFLYYFLSPEFQELLRSRTVHGSTVDRIPLIDFPDFQIPVPPIKVQRELVQVLGALDDKITLLRETNTTLEAIVQAIFKSWFVDFDPVRAKAEGRDPEGMPPEVADLFPSEFEESELGSIPKGWRVVALRHGALLHKKGRNPQDEPLLKFEHYSLPAFDSGQYPLFEDGESIKSNKFTVPRDSVLVSKLNPHIPRMWLPKVISPALAVCSTEFLVLVPRLPMTREWLYQQICSDSWQSRIRQLVTGTSNSHQRIKPDNLMDLPIVLPAEGILSYWTEVVSPLFERVMSNRDEQRSLSDIRDTLLPRLISGNLRIPSTQETSV